MNIKKIRSMERKAPNCDKLTKHIEEYNAIAEFLDFCNSKKISLYKIRTIKNKVFKNPAPIYDAIDDIDMIYKYLGINGKKLEKERRALLEAIRSS